MSVTLHTTHGDLKVELFCEAVPQTAENFLALCACGAYNDTPFHRLIPGFMIQGGDISLGQAARPSSSTKPMLPFEIPKGGTSIHHPSGLNQEIHLPTIRHNARGILSMASRPVKDRTARALKMPPGQPSMAANSSLLLLQRHILMVLDEGGDVLAKLEKANAKVDKKGKVTQPKEGDDFEALRINSVTIHANPFAT
ncbi:Peptidyl-prolyl cis-trans isomerase-like 3 [Penicillium chermesinum]|nr:Peptidyl-prolyl cis-trans isomerase-like 3 [Penicillium chermesinum]